MVLCPSNTFMATPLSVLRAGGRVEFVDCNRDELCMSLADLERKLAQHKPRAVWLVHIGGHIAFEVEQIAELCRAAGVSLLEDCAHAHGADWNGRRPGGWGDAGVWSFYATKTISTGEGGMLVSRHPERQCHSRRTTDRGSASDRDPLQRATVRAGRRASRGWWGGRSVRRQTVPLRPLRRPR